MWHPNIFHDGKVCLTMLYPPDHQWEQVRWIPPSANWVDLKKDNLTGSEAYGVRKQPIAAQNILQNQYSNINLLLQ